MEHLFMSKRHQTEVLQLNNWLLIAQRGLAAVAVVEVFLHSFHEHFVIAFMLFFVRKSFKVFGNKACCLFCLRILISSLCEILTKRCWKKA